MSNHQYQQQIKNTRFEFCEGVKNVKKNMKKNMKKKVKNSKENGSFVFGLSELVKKGQKKRAVLGEIDSNYQNLQKRGREDEKKNVAKKRPRTSTNSISDFIENLCSPMDEKTQEAPTFQKVAKKIKTKETDTEKDEKEYKKLVLENLKLTEHKYVPKAGYLKQIQVGITSDMRGILTDWMCEVIIEYELSQPTLYLSINLLDRFLGTLGVEKSKLQLVGVTCILIAAKFYELCSPCIDDFVYITDNTYSRKNIIDMEAIILNTLEFNVTVVSPLDFLWDFLECVSADKYVSQLAKYYCELSLLCYSMVNMIPSKLAGASVVLALYTFDLPYWNDSMEKRLGYSKAELRDSVKLLDKNVLDYSNSKELTSLKDKYSKTEKLKISLVKRNNKSIPF